MFIEDQVFDDVDTEVTEVDKNKDSKQFEIKFHALSIPIKNEKIKNSLQKIESTSEKIEIEIDLNKKINPYTDIFNLIDDLLKIQKKERADEVNPSESNI